MLNRFKSKLHSKSELDNVSSSIEQQEGLETNGEVKNKVEEARQRVLNIREQVVIDLLWFVL